MYIKLGTIGVNYSRPSINDFMIFSEVPNTRLSYESPVVVRTLDELDIWFGRSCADYFQLRSVINKNGVLYLYGPTSTSQSNGIDISGYTEVWYDDENHIPFPESVIKDYGYTGETGKKYNIDGTWFIWDDTEGAWVSEGALPQYIQNLSQSLNNRDTLAIDKYGNGCSARFRKDAYGVDGFYSNLDNIVDNGAIIDDTVRGNTYNIVIDGDESASLGNGYLVINYNDLDYLFLAGTCGTETDDTNPKSWFPDLSSSRIVESLSTVSDLINAIEDKLGFDTITNGTKNTIWSRNKFEYSEICKFSNTDIAIYIDEDTNNDLLYLTIRPNTALEFWSKTIGRDVDVYDDSRDISVSIENLGDGEYRVEIRRYEYSEIFTGRFNTGVGETRLDHKISKESKLVYCALRSTDFNLGTNIYKGKLSGAKAESVTTGYFWNSLRLLMEEEVYPDFFLVPNLSLFGNVRNDQYFLDYAQEKNMQFLVSLNTMEEVQGNIGLIQDTENRIMYFNGDIKVNNYYFPSYYPFISGILKNSYVFSAQNIENKLLINVNPYNTEENLLDQAKCNYLVCNNQKYYYRKYNSGSNYITTAWRRFIIGKVYRELEKNKWEYLATRVDGLIRNKIDEILKRISTNFSSIRSIEITSYVPNPAENTIDLEIDVYTTDLVDNNIKLDITINYKYE